MGNCGVGFAPVRPDRHEFLISVMEGVEDIPGAALAEGVSFNWESFPEYLDAVEAIPHAIDIGAQMPHSALRVYVMGDRGRDHEEVATEAEIAEMRRLTAEALAAGALGFTTSRTINHRDRDGNQIPTLTNAPAELWGISQALRDAGFGHLEIVSDFVDLDKEFDIFRGLSDSGNAPLSILLIQNDQSPDRWREILKRIAAERAAGHDLTAQVAIRPGQPADRPRIVAAPLHHLPHLPARAGTPRPRRTGRGDARARPCEPRCSRSTSTAPRACRASSPSPSTRCSP